MRPICRLSLKKSLTEQPALPLDAQAQAQAQEDAQAQEEAQEEAQAQEERCEEELDLEELEVSWRTGMFTTLT